MSWAGFARGVAQFMPIAYFGYEMGQNFGVKVVQVEKEVIKHEPTHKEEENGHDNMQMLVIVLIILLVAVMSFALARILRQKKQPAAISLRDV